MITVLDTFGQQKKKTNEMAFKYKLIHHNKIALYHCCFRFILYRIAYN